VEGEFIGIPLETTTLRYQDPRVGWTVSASALKGHVSLIMPMRTEEGVLYNGRHLSAGGFGAYSWGSEFFSRSSSPILSAYIPFEDQRFADAFHALVPNASPDQGATMDLLPASAPFVGALHEMVCRVYTAATGTPDALGDQGTRIGLERNLLTLFALAVVRGREADQPLKETTAHERGKLLRQVHAHLQDHLHEPIYMIDLCQATGASERHLQQVFREFYGMRPMEFLKMRRLDLVNLTLAMATDPFQSVKRAALDHGFWDLGRFAVEYRRRFGETPSTTLRRALVRNGLALPGNVA
jgi:AraC-like DNA-binding protein